MRRVRAISIVSFQNSMLDLRSASLTIRSPFRNVDNNVLRECIASLQTANAKLAKEKADAIHAHAKLQEEHAETWRKYKDAHARWSEAHNRLNKIEESMDRRIAEKDKEVEKVALLTKENAKLLRVHADLAKDNADLEEETSMLVGRIQPFEKAVMSLRAENDSLKEHFDAIKTENDSLKERQKRFDVVKAEDGLQRQVKADRQSHWRMPDRGRSRSRYRSRSPRNSYRGDSRSPSRYRERSRGRSGYRGHSSHRYDNHAPTRSEPLQAPRSGYTPRIAHRDRSRLPTPGGTPDASIPANCNPNHNSPNKTRAEVDTGDTKPKIPTGPKAGVFFSMGQVQNKNLPDSAKKTKTNVPFGGGKGPRSGRK